MRRENCAPLPEPLSKDLTFLVREAWPSVVTGTALVDGRFSPGASLTITSEMNVDGIVFGDGIEQDALELPFGQVLTVQAAPIALHLVP